MIPTIIPDHKEMATALRSTATLLSNVHILSQEGVNSIEAAVARLYNCPGKSWFCTTPKSEPIQFEACFDRAGRQFIPKIGVDRIEIKDEVEKLPFVKWDINLYLEYKESTVHCPRWHFDLCNPNQDGPITHLQYGGNKHPDQPNLDVKIREPRWNVPPMDIVLLCETVAANFFTEIWRTQLKDNPTWNKTVKASQRLCYPYYMRKLYKSLNDTGGLTLLNESWNTVTT